MPNLENRNSPDQPHTWNFVDTLLVGVMAYVVCIVTWWLVLVVAFAMQDGRWAWSPYGATYILASAAVTTLLWAAIRLAGRDFAEYLALNWPSPDQLLRALGITAILMAGEVLSFHFVKQPLPDAYAGAPQAGGFLIFLIGVCIADPIMEEFVYRGFLFRGWSQSFLGPVGSIVLTSILFAMTHIQYDLFGRFWIFVTGLVLGHFRWRSNSTWLTVMVHSAINMLCFFTAGLQF